MTLLDLLVLGLSTWRVSNLLVNEDGPWDVFARFRCFVGVTFDEHSQPCATNILAKLLSCLFCLSLWVGLALVIAFVLWPAPTRWIALPFSLSAIAILVSKAVGQD